MSLQYDDLRQTFFSMGGHAGLESVLGALRAQGDHHGVFRALLLKKRYEMGLPLVNPGELENIAPEKRKEYESYVEETCRHIGQRYLESGNITQAYRYFSTLGEHQPIRDALDKMGPELFTDEVATVAIEQAVHPLRGFELTLRRHGLCRAITLFDTEFTTDVGVKKKAASLLVNQMYKELVLAISKEILEREGALPEDTDLVELIRDRPALFDDDRTYADPSHVSSVARIGLLCDDESDLISTLSIAEYGRKMADVHQWAQRAPFEAGYADHAKYARALLGQNIDETVNYFRDKLVNYTTELGEPHAAELVLLLLWRCDRKREALDLWQQYLHQRPPELPGVFIDSYYDLCIQADEFDRLAESARGQSDSSAWASAMIMATDAHAPRA
jgi:hypothetical protein